jgi:hypothetical protein
MCFALSPPLLQELEEAADLSAARHYDALILQAQKLTQEVEEILAMTDQHVPGTAY